MAPAVADTELWVLTYARGGGVSVAPTGSGAHAVGPRSASRCNTPATSNERAGPMAITTAHELMAVQQFAFTGVWQLSCCPVVDGF